MRRKRSWWALGAGTVAALLLAGCGGDGSPTGPPPPDNPAIVTLDASNFDALVLGSTRPCMVEFHNPT